MPKAVPGLGQRRRDISRRDRLARCHTPAGAAGQCARVAGGVDLIGHGLPVGVGGLSVGVDALKLRSAADGPIEAARAVVVEIWVAEIILQLGVLLQPVGQRLQFRHSVVNFLAGVGGHGEVGRSAVGVHAHHRAHGRGKGAFRKVGQRKHAVVCVIEGAEGQHADAEHDIRDDLRGQSLPAALARQHHGHNDGGRRGERQQEQPGVLAVQIAAGQTRARRGQPRPERPFRREHRAQRHARHARKEVQAQRRKDVVPVDAQRVGRPARRQKRQHRKQTERQHTALCRVFFAPQRRKGKRRQQCRPAPERRPADKVRQVQRVQQCQPHREEHSLGQRQIIIRAQPLSGCDMVGRAEHQLVVQRRTAHPDVRLLKARQRQTQADQQGAEHPESAAGQPRAKMLHR